MPTAPDAAALAQEVIAAVEGAEQDLGRMPFVFRPMVRRGFASRTGLSHQQWREQLAALRASDTPAAVRARWQDVEAALGRLADDFRGAPERAARRMSDQQVLEELRARARQRVQAVEALLAWCRSRS